MLYMFMKKTLYFQKKKLSGKSCTILHYTNLFNVWLSRIHVLLHSHICFYFSLLHYIV